MTCSDSTHIKRTAFSLSPSEYYVSKVEWQVNLQLLQSHPESTTIVTDFSRSEIWFLSNRDVVCLLQSAMADSIVKHTNIVMPITTLICNQNID